MCLGSQGLRGPRRDSQFTEPEHVSPMVEQSKSPASDRTVGEKKALDLSRSRTEERLMVLVFQGARRAPSGLEGCGRIGGGKTGRLEGVGFRFRAARFVCPETLRVRASWNVRKECVHVYVYIHIYIYMHIDMCVYSICVFFVLVCLVCLSVSLVFVSVSVSSSMLGRCSI